MYCSIYEVKVETSGAILKSYTFRTQLVPPDLVKLWGAMQRTNLWYYITTANTIRSWPKWKHCKLLNYSSSLTYNLLSTWITRMLSIWRYLVITVLGQVQHTSDHDLLSNDKWNYEIFVDIKSLSLLSGKNCHVYEAAMPSLVLRIVLSSVVDKMFIIRKKYAYSGIISFPYIMSRLFTYYVCVIQRLHEYVLNYINTIVSVVITSAVIKLEVLQ